MRTISEEMDDDLEMIERSAQRARPPLENLTSAQPAVGTTSVMREVVVDPRLLTKPGDCPNERGTLWRLWRSKMEGWTYGISVRLGQAMEQAAAHPGIIKEIPLFLKQASSFLYAELLGATTGVQMEIIL